MSDFFNCLLTAPLYLLVMLMLLNIINKHFALILWISFFTASVFYAVTENALISVIALFLVITIIDSVFLFKGEFKKARKEKSCYIALCRGNNAVMFSDGKRLISKELLDADKIFIGNVYIVTKIN